MNFITSAHVNINGYLALPNIQLVNLPGSIKVGEKELLKKSEFHITLVNTGYLASKIDIERKVEIAEEIEREFKEFVGQKKLKNFMLTKQFYHFLEDALESVVVLCMVPGLDELFELFEDRFEIELPVQPAHITLFTSQKDAIIPINSVKQMNTYGKPINVAELDKLEIAA